MMEEIKDNLYCGNYLTDVMPKIKEEVGLLENVIKYYKEENLSALNEAINKLKNKIDNEHPFNEHLIIIENKINQ